MSSKEHTVLRRRSGNYTTYFANGCVWQFPEESEIGDNTSVIMDFLYRSTMAGEPFQVTFDKQGCMIPEEHAKMIDSMVLVGVAMPKHILMKLSKIALEEFGDAVVLNGEEAAAYRASVATKDENELSMVEELEILLKHGVEDIPIEKERASARGEADDRYDDGLIEAYKWVLRLMDEPELRQTMLRLKSPKKEDEDDESA